MNKKREFYLDAMNVIAAFAVLFLHVNTCYWVFAKETYWNVANVIECVCYFAVPLFFMIDGALSFNYRDKYSTKDFLIKRIKKVLIPYLFWSTIAYFFVTYYTHYNHTPSFGHYLHTLFYGDVQEYYWFIPSIIIIYLATPFISKLKDNKKLLKVIVALGIVISSAIYYLISKTEMMYYHRTLIYSFSYIIYPIIGYYFANNTFSKKTTLVIYILGVVGLLTHLLGTRYLSYQIGDVDIMFKGYANWPCFLYSIGIFLLLKNILKKIECNWINKIVNFFRPATFFVYLTQYFVIQYCLLSLHIDKLSMLFRLGAPIAIGVILTLLHKLISKIPVLNKIVL